MRVLCKATKNQIPEKSYEKTFKKSRFKSHPLRGFFKQPIKTQKLQYSMSVNRLVINANRKEENQMAVLMTAKEISEELGISKTLAYQIMEKLNKELEAKGYFVIKGKVSRRYLSEQIYGMPQEK